MKKRTRSLVVRLVLTLSLLVIAAAGPGGATRAIADESADRHSNNVSVLARIDAGTGGEIAFWENRAVAAFGPSIAEDPRDDGFVLLDISRPAHPREISRFTCSGSGSDIAVWDDLVFLSVNVSLDGTSCDAGPATPHDADAFAGIRVVSIKNPNRPEQVATVATNSGEGSHTATVLPDLDHKQDGRDAPRLLVYASGLRPEAIIEVPLKTPSKARLVGNFETLPGSAGCHDLSFFVPRDLALCAGVDESQLWDVSDPERPVILSHIVNPLIHHNHGAAFSWDGETLVIAEENLENLALNGCAGGSGSPQGALWFYDVSDPRVPQLRGRFQIPQTSGVYCTAHQFNVVPLSSGRDVLVAGWYSAGTTIVDFTDPANPFQIGFHQGNPSSASDRSNSWSSYWYDGHVYVSNFALPGLVETKRGLDVLSVTDPAFTNVRALGRYNFGLQEEIPGLTP